MHRWEFQGMASVINRMQAGWMMYTAVLVLGVSTVQAQFIDTFDNAKADNAVTPPGWTCYAGDGQATIQFIQQEGFASAIVDASLDKRNIWWAIIRTQVDGLNLEKLTEPEFELRVEARVRTSHAPRRINLSLSHSRTTDYHSNLMEFDIPEKEKWHTVSMTTKGFDARPGDQVYAQLAMMDWGRDIYKVDVDYYRVDVVPAEMIHHDLGNPLPYHPPIPEPSSFDHRVPVHQDAVVDTLFPEMNFRDWQSLAETGPVILNAVSGTQLTLLRWDLSAYAGKKASGPGLLELSTYSLQRSPMHEKDFGMVRISEVLSGDQQWDRKTVTLESFCSGMPLDEVINSQMVIDFPVNPEPTGKSWFVINEQVMNRLLDGTSKGLSIKPLGAVNATFFSRQSTSADLQPRLLFNLE